MVTGFLHQLLELHLDLIDEVEQELQGEAEGCQNSDLA